MTPRPLPDADPEWTPRFMAKVFEHEGHWLWTGQATITPNRKSFSMVFHGESAVRYAQRSYRGEIPEGSYLRRTCDQLFCVNPWHHRSRKTPPPEQEPAMRRDACSHGHKYTEGSHWFREKTSTSGTTTFIRVCRLCNARRKRKYLEKKAGE